LRIPKRPRRCRSGAGSLRQAIFDSNAAGGSNTITIAAGTTVTLSQSLPMITTSVTVTGNGNTLDANSAGRAFFVQAGTVAISNLTINNAVAQGGAGGTANNINGGGGGGGGGATTPGGTGAGTGGAGGAPQGGNGGNINTIGSPANAALGGGGGGGNQGGGGAGLLSGGGGGAAVNGFNPGGAGGIGGGGGAGSSNRAGGAGGDFGGGGGAAQFSGVACTRFRGHRVRCHSGAGGGLWNANAMHESSSLRL
jgi:hypothetical protein